MKYISIIDMGVNNIRSVVGVLNHLDFETIITKDKDKIMNSSALILPGVGSFPEGMNNLKKNGLDSIIKNFFKQGKPILAICLGFQMLFTSSEEFGTTKGLSIINGKVRSLKSLKIKKTVPNLGWNIVKYKKKKTNYLYNRLVSKPSVYFIHSYYVETKDKQYITSSINFSGKEITTSIQYKNLYGVQFHPEKSGKNGIVIIKNFLSRIKK